MSLAAVPIDVLKPLPNPQDAATRDQIAKASAA